ncbi:protein-L-isoaspartate O-methyltransferase, partial [Candidatus Omnitrophota bacterium]
ILSWLCSKVYTIERVPFLGKAAQERLNMLGYSNIEVRIGDGSLGLREFAPYDGIVVTSGAPSVPQPLKDQLADDGLLVVPVGNNASQELTVVEKKNDSFIQTENCSCVFVPLIGKYGWQEND